MRADTTQARAPLVQRLTIEKFKVLHQYERSPARCSNCQHYAKAKTVLRDSLPVACIAPMCGMGGFTTHPKAICNAWIGFDGATLAEGATA